MVRPENGQLATGHPDGIPASIFQVNYLGPTTEYLLESAVGLFRVLELRRMGATPHGEGARLRMSWKPEEALVYPEACAQ